MVQAFIKTKYKTNHSVAYDSRADTYAVRENDDNRIVL